MWSFRILMSRPCPCTSVFNPPLYEPLYTAIILGDPGVDSAGGEGKWVPENFCVFLPNQKSERRRPFGTGLVRHCPQGLFLPFFTFLRAIFFCPFIRLSLTPGTICPWVSEDVRQWRSVTILSSTHVGLYGFKYFIKDSVFAFL